MLTTFKPIITAAMLCAWSQGSWAQYAEQKSSGPTANTPLSAYAADRDQLFNFGWRFTLGNPEGAEKPGFDDSAWRTLDLPHDYQFEQPWDSTANRGRGFKPMCEGWYRKTFRLPASLKGQRVTLDFEGVMYVADIYVNGTKAASNEYGYTGFEADITRHLRYGEDNVVAVYSSTGPERGSRWYTGGGIYRNVWLRASGSTRIARHGLYVTTSGDTVKAQVQVAGWQKHDITVRTVVKDAEGHIVAQAERGMPDHTIQNDTEVMMPAMRVASPSLWDISSPTLYSVEATLIENGAVIDSTATRFGFRTIEYGPSFGFKLNGRKVFLTGIANHHDLGALGAAAYRTAIERELKTLKAFGYNAIRCSHNPYSNDLYDVADEVGLLVVDELTDKWSNSEYWGGRQPFMNIWTQLMQEWVKRDRNHPSVVLWSLGNELQTRPDWSGYDTGDWGITTYRIFDQMLKRYDTTRPTTVAMFPARAGAQRGTPDFKTYLVPPELACATEVASFNYQWDAYPGYYSHKPDLILFQSEAVTKQMQQPFYGMDRQRGVGLCWWGAIEYWGESDGWPKKGWNYSFFSHTLRPYPQAYLIKASIKPEEKLVKIGVADGKDEAREWNDVKVGQQRISRNWNRRPGSKPTVYTYTNADEVELFCNGRSLGTMRNDTTQVATRNVIAWPAVAYEQGGRLEAVARQGGKVVARDTVETTGKAVALRVTAEPGAANAKADGLSLIYLNIEAIDANGRAVPAATDKVSVEVSGEATFVALDNGDHYTNDIFMDVKQRDLMGGYAQCVLRATRKAGRATVTVSSPTLKGAKLVVKTRL